MAKKNKHRFLKLSFLTFLSYHGGKYVFNHPHPVIDLKQNIKETVASVHQFSQDVAHLKTSTSNLQQAIDKTQPTIRAIQQDVARFEYKLKPRLEKIDQLTQDINNQLEGSSQTKDKK